ncbi:MAG TPA: TolC family protein [Longimicrobiaceae bacterium]|nr:TolC family protein [Longimicrobiaceae bacterium]
MNASLWRHGAVALTLALVPAALAAQATPAGGTLTLQQAVEAARQNNPDFLQTANDVRAARASVRQARMDLLPTANASTNFGYTAAGTQRVGVVSVGGEQPAYYTSGFNLSSNYQLSRSKMLAPGVARAQEAAARQRVAGTEANLVGQVAQEYLSVLQAQEQVTQATQDVARTAEHVRLAQARLQVGAGTPLDLRQAEVQKGQADVKLVQQQAVLETERLRLGQLLGTPLAPDTRLVSQFALFEPTWRPDSLVAIALRNNPNLLAARATQNAAQTQVRQARSAYLPSLGAQVSLNGYTQQSRDEGLLFDQSFSSLQQGFQSCQRNNLINQSVGLGVVDCGTDPSLPASQAELRSRIGDLNGKFPFSYTRQPLQAGLTVSLPIFTGGQRSRQIEEARVQAEDARLAVRSTELRLGTEIAGATLTLRTAYRTAQLQEQVAQKAAEELRLAQERFRYGAANSIDVTDAQGSLAQAEQARIDAVYAFHKSLAALEALIGQPLR